MKRTAAAMLASALITTTPSAAFGQPAERALVTTATARGGFPLYVEGQAAAILHDRDDAPVVGHAVEDLASDLEAVTGVRPRLATDLSAKPARIVVVGTLGKNALIRRLIAERKLDVSKLRGAWESYVIATVRRPLPGVESALVVVGSDRRGAAYGAYELSQGIGVSPWRWWSDVAPAHADRLFVTPGVHRFEGPSVQYRGIFINDEDWGLLPWASRTFDPATGNFGPKTYRKVFELLLRLKANTLWPAMHRPSKPFNADPANARLADEYAIVMGSSHAEPMLRNNVGEWTDASARFNYAENSSGVRAYWQKRVEENARYESLWTVGMRGIHDSGMNGGATMGDKVALLDRIIGDQREMLSGAAPQAPYGTPQVFMPYKEVLDLYRAGLKVPDDVTLMWPDDNFGYVRHFPTETERRRSGGAGIYYHLSYLGAPLSYLWLSTTPPALVQEEMVRAWDQGARKIWILNVGDIKPAEIGISHFFDLAWNVAAWRGRSQSDYVRDWAGRTFGAEAAEPVGRILDEYFRLNFERRPEHLQWWLPGERVRDSDLTPAMADERLRRFDALTAATDRVGTALPARLQDAWFELVSYPVQASSAANWRYFAAERYAQLIDTQPLLARSAAGAVIEADARIKELTRRFNNELGGGKWHYIIAEEPADNIWGGVFRLTPVTIPAPGVADAPLRFHEAVANSQPGALPAVVEAEDARRAAGWRFIQGLGRGRGAMVADNPGRPLAISLTVPRGATRRARLGLLPLYPLEGDGSELRLEISIDGRAPQMATAARRTESAAWSREVLANLIYVPLPSELTPGRHEVSIVARSSGVALDRVELFDASGPSSADVQRH